MKKKHLKKNKPLFMAAVVAAAYIAANYMPSLAATYNVTDFSGDDGLKNAFGNGEYFDGTDTQNLTSGDTVLFGGNITGSETLTQKVSGIILDGGGNTYSADAGLDTGIIIGTGSTLTVKDLTVSGFANAIQNAGTLNFTGNDSIAGNLDNSSTVNNSGTLTVSGSVNSSGGSVSNSGSFQAEGANSSFGLYEQADSSAETIISGSNTVISNASITGGKLDVESGGSLNISGGSVSSSASVVMNGDVTVSGGNVQIENSDSLNSGTLTLNGNNATLGLTGKNTGSVTLNAQNGKLSLSNVTLSGSDIIASAVQTTVDTDGIVIGGGSDVSLTGGDDSWTGDVTLSGGSLTVGNYNNTNTRSGALIAESGKLTIDSNGLTLDKAGDSVDYSVNTVINGNLTINNASASVNLDGSDKIDSTVTLTSGSLNLDGIDTTSQGGNIVANGGKVTIENNSVTLGKTGDSIGAGTELAVNENLSVSGGTVELNSNDTIAAGKKITLNSGKLSSNNFSTTAAGGSLDVQEGELEIKSGGLTLNNANDIIAEDASVKMNGDLNINAGEVHLDSSDTLTSGTINLGSSSTGELSLNGVTTGGVKINAQGGSVSLTDTVLKGGDVLGSDADVSLAGTTTITDAIVNLDSNDTWNSATTLNGGTLNLNGVAQGADSSIKAETGELNLDGQTLTITSNSSVADAVKTTIDGGSTLEVSGGSVVLNGASGADVLTSGTVKLTEGSLTLNNVTTSDDFSVSASEGSLQLSGVILNNESDIISDIADVAITNGITVNKGSITLDINNNNDSVSGGIIQTGGTVDVSNISTSSGNAINSTGGNLTLSNASLNGGDTISSAAALSLEGTTTITDATVNLDSNESWGDAINLQGGTLNLDSATQGNSKLNATGGTLNSNNTALTIGTGSQIAENVNAVLNGGSLTITADGNVELAGTNDTWNTKTTLNGGTLTLKGVEQGTSAALNALSGVLNIEEGQEVTIAEGNAVAEAVQTTIKGDSNLIVDGGTVVLNGTGTGADTLESGKVTLESGNLTLKDVETSTDFYVDSNGGSLTLNNVVLNNANDNVDKNSIVKVEGPLKITDGEVNLNTGDTWTGDITLSGGSLNYEGLKTNGKLVADGGNLSITGGENNTTLNIADGSSIAKAVQVEIDGNVKINGETASVILDGDTDTLTSGSIQLTDGYLEMNDLNTTKVSIQATGGDLTLNNVGLDNDRDDIKFGVHTTINGPVNITKGNVELDAEDTLNSNETITLNGENATLGVDGFATDTTNLSLQKGTLHIVNRGLTLNNASDLIQKEIKTIVDGNLTINQGTTYLNEGDEWNAGVITVNSDGKLQFENFKASSSNVLVMDGDAKTELLNSSVAIAQAENIKNGTMTVDNGSIISIGSGEYNLADMNTSGGIYTINGAYQTHNAQTMTILNSDYTTLDNNVVQTDGQANFGIDLFARLRETNQNSDVFKGADLTLSDTSSEGTVNISDWTLNGHLTRKDAPIDRYYNFKLFDYENIDSNIKFTATDKETFTPIGYYRLFGGKDGNYTLALTRYNPQVFRAQVTTLAQYNNILSTQDIVTNHVILHNERKLADMGQNRYAAATPTLGPYLYTQEDGGLWMKGYGDIEKLSMSQGLNVNNVSYGSIIGADFPLVNLKNGWKFIPTPFVGYNGAHQSFNGVSAYQNGGQAGFMGTFMKNNYISSHTIYGGGYYNEMHVDYVKDDTASWFWGTAHRFAYNWNIKRHVILQPTAFLSYNMFGKQNFHSEFGDMGMRAGMLNGINIAPGLNLIYMKDDWSLYGGVQYMWNINEQVSGRAGNVYIPNMNMRHGFIQYGIGGTKNIKDDLAAYGQVMFRNGGRTGVAFQVGLQYYFDIREIGSKIKSAFTRNPKVSNK